MLAKVAVPTASERPLSEPSFCLTASSSILLVLLLCLPSLGSLGLSPGSLSPGTSQPQLEIPYCVCLLGGGGRGLSDTNLQPLLSSRIPFLSFWWSSLLGCFTTSGLGVLFGPPFPQGLPPLRHRALPSLSPNKSRILLSLHLHLSVVGPFSRTWAMLPDLLQTPLYP